MATVPPIPDLVFTYSGDPANSSLDTVRFYCGDTDFNDPLLSDPEIDFVVASNPNLNFAASICLETLASKFTRKAQNLKADPLSKDYGDRAEKFREQAKLFRARAFESSLPFFGGLSISDKQSLAQDSDAVSPPFTRDQFDSPRASQFDGTSTMTDTDDNC